MKIVLCPVPLLYPLSVMSEPPRIYNALALGYIAAALNTNKTTENEEVKILEKESLLHTLKTLKKDILREQPDILGISVYIWNHQRVMKLCEMVKADAPDITVVLGGPQVTYTAEEVLRDNPSVDIIVRGEGEVTFCELVDALKKGSSLTSVKGITYRHNKQVVSNPDRPPGGGLDEIPSPYLTGILDLSLSEMLELEASRGCPYRCGYCVWHRLHKRVTFYSMERIFEILKFGYDKGIKKVVFWDSIFDSPKRARALCDYILREGLDLYVSIFLDPWSVNGEYLEMIKKVGTFSIDMGVQSMNSETLRLINRPTTVEQTRKALNLLKTYELEPICDIILGLPADTFQTVKAEIDFIASLGFPTNVYFLQLLPGSLLYETADEHGLVYMPEPPHMVYQTDSMSREELGGAFRYTYFARYRERIRRIIQEENSYERLKENPRFDSLFGS